MARKTIHTDDKGRTIEWDEDDQLFVIDKVKVTPDFLLGFVNADGSRAVRVKRVGDECHVQSFDVEVQKSEG